MAEIPDNEIEAAARAMWFATDGRGTAEKYIEKAWAEFVREESCQLYDGDGIECEWHNGKDFWRICATAALTAAAAVRAPVEPVGWRLVPVEATLPMVMAAGKYADYCAVHNYGGPPDAAGTWEAMLAASPPPPSPSSEGPQR